VRANRREDACRIIIEDMNMQPHRANPKIYFLCPDDNTPWGGIKILYRHVDLLNSFGFHASILHSTPGFKCTWFINNTRITSTSEVGLAPEDYLVIPEIYGRQINNMRGMRKVIFNQGCYNTFRDYGLDQQEIITPYTDHEVLACLVVSEDSASYLRYVFPNLRVFRIHNSIDPHTFVFQPQKKKQISFMTGKSPQDLVQVVNILKLRGYLHDFEFVPIENRTENEVADIMRDSLVFLSFGHAEGFSLPPAEAMACGCLVIGYDGMGGKEYFKPEFSFPIEVGKIIEFVRTVEEVANVYRVDPAALRVKSETASAFIREEYSVRREWRDLLQFWTEIMDLSGR
jgi:hypothetical protein